MSHRQQSTRRIFTKWQKEILKNPKNQNNQLSDSDTLDEEPIHSILKTSIEERHYGMIPGSALATQAALSHSRAQANPTVDRGPSDTIRVKKLPKEKATDKSI